MFGAWTSPTCGQVGTSPPLPLLMARFRGDGIFHRAAKLLLRSPHLECAVVVLGAVSREKVRRRGPAFVSINAAGQLAQVLGAGEVPRAVTMFELQRHAVTIAKDFPVGGAKAGQVAAIAFPGQKTAQPAFVAVDFTQPLAFPTAFDGIRRFCLLRRRFPTAIERGTATLEQCRQGDGQGTFRQPPGELQKLSASANPRNLLSWAGFHAADSRLASPAGKPKFPNPTLTRWRASGSTSTPLGKIYARSSRNRRQGLQVSFQLFQSRTSVLPS